MDSIEYKRSIKLRMLKILDSLLEDKDHTLTNLRELLKLRHEIDLSNDELFLPFLGICSEADEFPTGKTREHYKKETLCKYDEELSLYLSQSADLLKKTSLILRKKIESIKI